MGDHDTLPNEEEGYFGITWSNHFHLTDLEPHNSTKLLLALSTLTGASQLLSKQILNKISHSRINMDAKVV